VTYAIYRLAMWALVPWALLRLVIRARKQTAYLSHIGERFGFYTQKPTRPVIWIHAVSVGETRAAEPLVRALCKKHPDKQILLTNMTPTGREASASVYGDRVLRCYLPYDLTTAVKRFLSHFSPGAAIILETELWPTLVASCSRDGIPVYLVNARLSERSANRYARFAQLSRSMLAALRMICAQTERDAERFRSLGASRVQVTGNLKFDRAVPQEQLSLGAELRALFGHGRHVFLAASTRDGEEALIIDAISGIADPAMLTVIVPRHPQRFDDVESLLSQAGIAHQRRSENQPVAAHTRIVLGDSMGEMFAYYAACDVAFVGGSLLALGGQNLLEACAVGKPVIVGPHTFNFEEATEQAIDAGAAIRVDDTKMLRETVSTLLADRGQAIKIGEAGRRFMETHRGATRKTLEMIGL
jgi:3-deoxy-D-manno-octulosonic-acid transferase